MCTSNYELVLFSALMIVLINWAVKEHWSFSKVSISSSRKLLGRITPHLIANCTMSVSVWHSISGNHLIAECICKVRSWVKFNGCYTIVWVMLTCTRLNQMICTTCHRSRQSFINYWTDTPYDTTAEQSVIRTVIFISPFILIFSSQILFCLIKWFSFKSQLIVIKSHSKYNLMLVKNRR